MVQEVWFLHDETYYTISEYDQCVHFKSLNGIFIILVLYVDDMLVASKSMGKINKLNAQMAMTIVSTSKFEW